MRLPRPTIRDLLLLLAVVGIVLVQAPDLAVDPGVGWHLQTGKLIISNWVVPSVDPFLASEQPRPWVSDQWAGDVIFYLLYDIGGWALLVAAAAALYLAVFLVLLPTLLVRLTGYGIASSVASFYAFKQAQIHLLVRPVLFGFFCFVLTFGMLADDTKRRTEPEGVEPRFSRLLFLPLLFLCWANLHPSFVLGILLLGVWLGTGALAAYRSRRRGERGDKTFLRRLLITGCCVAATLINPYGVRLHESILELGGNVYFMNLHEEWLSPDPHRAEGQLLIAVVGIIALGFLRAGCRRRVTLFEVCAFLIFLCGAVDAVRMLPFFAVTASPLLAVALQQLGGDLRSRVKPESRPGPVREGIARICDRFSRWEPRERSTGIGISAAVLVLLCGWAALFRSLPGQPSPLGPPPDRYPYGAVQAVLRQSPGSGRSVFAPPEWGGFITWMSDGTLRPLADDRNTLLGEEFTRRFYALLDSGEGAEEFLERHGVQMAIVPAHSATASRLRSSGWTLLFGDAVSEALERPRPQSVSG